MGVSPVASVPGTVAYRQRASPSPEPSAVLQDCSGWGCGAGKRGDGVGTCVTEEAGPPASGLGTLRVSSDAHGSSWAGRALHTAGGRLR